MIIYGTQAADLGTTQVLNEVCPFCGEQGQIVLTAYRKHAHIFWIPLFPFRKKVVAQCQNCGKVIKRKDMSDTLKFEVDTLKSSVKGPSWQFAGLALLFVLGIFINYYGGELNEQELQYLAEPQVGDIYKYETENGYYSTLKVAEVTYDSIYVYPNTYESSKRKGVRKIDKEDNYALFTLAYHRSEIQAMYDERDIYSIDRD